MDFSDPKNIEQIIHLYINKGLSLKEIADICNTYPGKISKIIKRAGYELRSHSEAQALALSLGKLKHPTKGRKRTEEEKKLIGEGNHKVWSNYSEKEKEKRNKISKKFWEKMSPEKKEQFLYKARLGMRQASIEGSKLEKFIAQSIRDAGYAVERHRKGLVENDKLEVDIYVPSLNAIIEIDGPTHFENIWGEDHLAKNMRADNEKNGLLLLHGYIVIRFKDIKKNKSKHYFYQAAETVINKLKDIEENYPDKDNRLFELCVEDENGKE